MTDYTIPMIIGMTLAFALGAGFGGLWGLSRHEWLYCRVTEHLTKKEKKAPHHTLQEQGMRIKDDEIVSISEPEQPTSELTDFEKVLAECIDNAQCSVLNAEGIAVSWSDALMKEARKQIADSIDVNAMVARQSEYDYDYGLSDDDADFILRGYRLGIEEVIEKIKGKL